MVLDRVQVEVFILVMGHNCDGDTVEESFRMEMGYERRWTDGRDSGGIEVSADGFHFAWKNNRKHSVVNDKVLL